MRRSTWCEGTLHLPSTESHPPFCHTLSPSPFLPCRGAAVPSGHARNPGMPNNECSLWSYSPTSLRARALLQLGDAHEDQQSGCGVLTAPYPNAFRMSSLSAGPSVGSGPMTTSSSGLHSQTRRRSGVMQCRSRSLSPLPLTVSPPEFLGFFSLMASHVPLSHSVPSATDSLKLSRICSTRLFRSQASLWDVPLSLASHQCLSCALSPGALRSCQQGSCQGTGRPTQISMCRGAV